MKNVEDLFPLTPMQRVMLLHSRAHSGGHDALFHQFRFDLEGTPDASALEAAWNDAVALHPALRTCFVWEGVDEPLQVVRATAQVAFSISDAESDDALEAIRASDRARGFDLTRAPLIRLALVRRGEARATLLWSSHHLVLDRWCIGIVLADVAAAYGARRRGEEPPEPRRGRFRDYVAHVLGVPGSEV
ncbi:MAG: condensation domain-containing protein, partial [Planctomycetota bacterium]